MENVTLVFIRILITDMPTILISSILIAFFLIKGRRSGLLKIFLIMLFCIFVWAVTDAVKLVFTSWPVWWVVMRIHYLPVSFCGAIWLLFSLAYTRNGIKDKRWFFFLILPAFFYLFLLTTEYHGLFYHFLIRGERKRINRVLFWLCLEQNYVYTLTGTYIMIKHSIQNFNKSFGKSFLLVLAPLVPLIANILFITRIVHYDYTPFAFTVSLLIYLVITLRYKFLNVVPMAMDRIFSNMKEAILVIDNSSLIVNYNNAFRKLFLKNRKIHINDDASVIPGLMEDKLENLRDNQSESNKVLFTHVENYSSAQKIIKEDLNGTMEEQSGGRDTLNRLIDAVVKGTEKVICGELAAKDNRKRYYFVTVLPLEDNRNRIIGRIVSFNDITAYRLLLTDIGTKNRALIEKNEQLKEHAATVKELSVSRERNRIARDVHDTIGHTFTALISHLEVCKLQTGEGGGKKLESRITDSLAIARSGMNEIRKSISGLMSEELESVDIVCALEHIFAGCRDAGINITFSVSGLEPNLSFACKEAVYRSCQEGLTNAVRHGGASEITVILQFSKEYLKLFIIDNGKGCASFTKGNGLKGMSHRINSLNGKMSASSNGEEGFNICIEIPLAERVYQDKGGHQGSRLSG